MWLVRSLWVGGELGCRLEIICSTGSGGNGCGTQAKWEYYIDWGDQGDTLG